jgi:hypothetical protein
MTDNTRLLTGHPPSPALSPVDGFAPQSEPAAPVSRPDAADAGPEAEPEGALPLSDSAGAHSQPVPVNFSAGERPPFRPGLHPNSRGNLKRGENPEARAGRERAASGRPTRKGSRPVQTRDDILEVLREIAGDDGESGAYRVAASRLLLTPESGTTCDRPCCVERAVPKSVLAWLDDLCDEHFRSRSACGCAAPGGAAPAAEHPQPDNRPSGPALPRLEDLPTRFPERVSAPKKEE